MTTTKCQPSRCDGQLPLVIYENGQWNPNPSLTPSTKTKTMKKSRTKPRYSRLKILLFFLLSQHQRKANSWLLLKLHQLPQPIYTKRQLQRYLGLSNSFFNFAIGQWKHTHKCTILHYGHDQYFIY